MGMACVTRSHALRENGRSAALRRCWTRSVRGWRSHAEHGNEKTFASRQLGGRGWTERVKEAPERCPQNTLTGANYA